KLQRLLWSLCAEVGKASIQKSGAFERRPFGEGARVFIVVVQTETCFVGRVDDIQCFELGIRQAHVAGLGSSRAAQRIFRCSQLEVGSGVAACADVADDAILRAIEIVATRIYRGDQMFHYRWRKPAASIV